MTKPLKPYKGRFAPSPSGELHFGSLVAAVGSYLQAKSNNGQWLIRIEDIDETRTVPHSASSILSTLDLFGFEWDEEIIHQSHRIERYEYYLKKLLDDGLIYACDCSRNKLKQENTGGVYPGYCRQKSGLSSKPHALRCLTTAQQISFNDQIQGLQTIDLEKECGDFIVKRRDGFFAYQLAVVVDDAEQGITEIVRGTDLLSATAQQVYLQQQLGFNQTQYAHLPIVMHKNGNKLSKSHQDLPLEKQRPVEIMTKALIFLNQSPPEDLSTASLKDFWAWSIQNWDIDRVPANSQSHFDI